MLCKKIAVILLSAYIIAKRRKIETVVIREKIVSQKMGITSQKTSQKIHKILALTS